MRSHLFAPLMRSIAKHTGGMWSTLLLWLVNVFRGTHCLRFDMKNKGTCTFVYVLNISISFGKALEMYVMVQYHGCFMYVCVVVCSVLVTM